MNALSIPYKFERGNLLSNTFSNLRWPLSILVVINHYFHIYSFSVGTVEYDPSSSAATIFIYNIISSFIRNYSAPIFYFMSGYLVYLGERFTWRGYAKKMLKLPRKIVIPYVIWCSFPLIMCFFAGLYYHTIDISLSDFNFHNIKNLVFTTYGRGMFPTNTPLWYMRDYILIMVALPVFHWLLIKSKGWLLLVLSIAFIYTFNDNCGWRFQESFFFFFFGYWMRCSGKDVLALFKRYFPYTLVGYLLFGTLYYIYFDAELDNSVGMPMLLCIGKNIAICCGIPTVIYGMSLIVKRGWFKIGSVFVSSSFFIYVAHFPIMPYILNMVFKLFNCSGNTGPYCIALVVASVFTPLFLTGIHYLLNRYLPSLTKVLDGR